MKLQLHIVTKLLLYVGSLQAMLAGRSWLSIANPA
jgi:hypothetical protein